MFSGLPAVLCQTDCEDTVIGNNDENKYTEATVSMIYLNLNNPAQCNGTVSSYRYCHYGTSQSGNSVQFNAILAVFRKVDNTYRPVAGSDITLTMRNNNQFNCLSADLEGLIQVQPDDVLGACVARGEGGNPSNRQQLNLAGNNMDESVLLSGVAVTGVCDSTNVQGSATVAINELMNISGRVLHLSAEFGEL